jgi:predicted peroxiredoxin
MMLGIIVNTDRHMIHLAGIARASQAKGHEVNIFLTDAGTGLLHDPAMRDLALLQGVTISYCLQSAKRIGIAQDGIPPEIVAGSQVNNAIMNHHADKVIVL